MKDESSGQKGGRGKSSPQDCSRERLQGSTEQGQERFRGDRSVISHAKSPEKFRPEPGRLGTQPKHMGTIRRRLFEAGASEAVLMRL